METILNIQGFENRGLKVKHGLFTGSRIFIDNVQVKQQKGKMVVKNNLGQDVVFTWKKDPLLLNPKLDVDGKLIDIFKPFKWYEYVWIAFPIILVSLGGAIGGLLGGIATVINASIFKSPMKPALKYLLSFLVTCTAIVVWMILAVIIRSMINKS